VIATLPSTLEPTVDLIRRRAVAGGSEVSVTAEVVDGAFEAVMAGRGAEHDAKVSAALKRMATQVDVIVLAQASMARVVDTLAPADRPVPILSSPRSAVEHLAGLLAG
jgi:Asp/Glu/hydantoin racemase